MRRLAILAVLALALVGCGSSSKSSGPPKPAHGTLIVFGIKGGNIAPFTITITSTGQITDLGSLQITKHHLPRATAASLSSAVRSGLPKLSSRSCNGTLPDVGARWIRAVGKTVTVHGSCEAGFEQLWSKLTSAVGFD